MKTYISTNSNILNGKPVISGTRIPITQVIFLIREGYTLKEIHGEYPNVSLATFEGLMDELARSISNTYNGTQTL